MQVKLTCDMGDYWTFSVFYKPNHNCPTNPHPMTLTQHQGYLSGYVTSHTLCGAQHSPWVVQGQPGQKINLTLYDFSAAGKDAQNVEAVTCQKYATITGNLTE